MLVSLFRFFRGYLKIKIIGYSPERFINACSFHEIYIWNITPTLGSYELFILASDFHKLKPILRKTETKIQIIEKYGLPFFFFRYRKRKLFFIGFSVCLFLIFCFSKYTWNIDFIGNQRYTDEILNDFLSSKGIYCGMRTDQIECSRIVKDIRKEYSDIVWVSASIEGCNLIIRIKENENTAYDSEEKNSDVSQTGTDILAAETGVIKKIITRTGIPLVKEGACVQKGDVLVSGSVPIYNDSGELTDIRLKKSEADIIEEYTVDYLDTVSLSKEVKDYHERDKKCVYFRFGEYLICFGNTKHTSQNAEVVSSYDNIISRNHFIIPVSSCVQVTTLYSSDTTRCSDDEITEKLSVSFRKFCEDQKKKGVEIIQNNVKIYNEGKLAVAKGTLVVRAAVSVEKKTTITEDTVDGND